MRYGSLCSALLHGGLVALLVINLDDAGGAPSLGAGGGAVSFEVVTSIPGAVPSEETLAAAATVDEARETSDVTDPAATPLEEPSPEPPLEVATAAPPPPVAAAPPPPPPPHAAVVAESFDLPPVPIGPDPNTPSAALPNEPNDEVMPLPQELAERPPEPALAPRPREPRLPEEELPEAAPGQPKEPPLETVEVFEDALALAEQPVERPDPQADQIPPEKPTRKVEVPAPKLVKKEPPKEAAPQPVEQAAAEPDAGDAAETAAAQPAGAQQAALPGDDSSNDVGSQGAPGPAGGATVGMSAGELQDYAGVLVAWLDRHKRYPDPSRRRKEEGIVVVEFAIDGQGRVLSHRLLDASGHPLLDAEAEALLARASPVPAPPDGTGRSFQVPIVFALR